MTWVSIGTAARAVVARAAAGRGRGYAPPAPTPAETFAAWLTQAPPGARWPLPAKLGVGLASAVQAAEERGAISLHRHADGRREAVAR